MNSTLPIKKLSMVPFLSNIQKGKQTKVTFESLPKPRLSPRSLFDENVYSNTEKNISNTKSVPSLRPFTKSLQMTPLNAQDDDITTMATINTHLDIPRDDEDYDLGYTPYEYDYLFGQRPQTSYLSVPFANRNRALESIAECRTPSSSSASSRGGNVSPDYNQILDVRREKFMHANEHENVVKSAPLYNSRIGILPKIKQDPLNVTPVKVKPVLSLRHNERLPSISSAIQRFESTETFLANSRLLNNSRSESVESIRTPSTSRHLLWSRGSIMSDGGFPKNRSDTSITRISHQSDPTPTIPNDFPKSGKQRKKARKHRRKAATKVCVPYQSFLESVIGKQKENDNIKSKSYIRSANFTLYFPSIHKKCTITPIKREGKWCSK